MRTDSRVTMMWCFHIAPTGMTVTIGSRTATLYTSSLRGGRPISSCASRRWRSAKSKSRTTLAYSSEDGGWICVVLLSAREGLSLAKLVCKLSHSLSWVPSGRQLNVKVFEASAPADHCDVDDSPQVRRSRRQQNTEAVFAFTLIQRNEHRRLSCSRISVCQLHVMPKQLTHRPLIWGISRMCRAPVLTRREGCQE